MRSPPPTPKRCLMIMLAAMALVSLPWVSCTPGQAGQEAEEQGESNLPEILAVIGENEISRDAVLEGARERLDKLELERLQFEAKYKRGHYEALQSSLAQLVQQDLMEKEAAQRSTDVDGLLEVEVQNKVQEPTEEAISEVYEANKKRLGKPLEEVEPQIRQYLKNQSYNQNHNKLVERLKEKYPVEYLFEAPRVEIAVDGSPSEGPTDAAVTIVEFSDFQCPYCARIQPTLKQLKETYGEKLRLVFRQFPLNSIHPQAQKAAEASLCANDQNRFWEMHDVLFETGTSLKVEDIKKRAANLKLNQANFDQCLDSGKYAAVVQQDVLDGVKAGVTGTPALFINGLTFSGSRSFEEISKVIEDELQKGDSSPEG